MEVYETQSCCNTVLGGRTIDCKTDSPTHGWRNFELVQFRIANITHLFDCTRKRPGLGRCARDVPMPTSPFPSVLMFASGLYDELDIIYQKSDARANVVPGDHE